ncbi:MAG TPA: YccF domain-containing protein [Halanaerobiales bacterium]|nr:YccF domain-containing protein [Halanaerobiales bacterium]
MSFIGNMLWIIFGGGIHAFGWFLSGLLWSITIIGIPYGKQCFKMARLQLFPFGKRIEDRGNTPLNFIANIIWIILFGWELALVNLISAFLFAITIIGIPFARQSLKLAMLSFMPFGKKIRRA